MFVYSCDTKMRVQCVNVIKLPLKCAGLSIIFQNLGMPEY